MAKGDHKRIENATQYQGGLAQNRLDNLRTDITRNNQNFENLFNSAVGQGQQDYRNIMSGYQNLLGRPASNQNFGAYSGYQDFANTGGYSPQDIQDLRARAISPLRGVYAQAQSELDRNRALQGGYSPNYAAASAKMTRQLGHEVADANTNVNASLADAIRQGKLAGLGGMTGIDSAKMQEALSNRGYDLSALSGMNSAYGQTPGQASLYGGLLQNSNQQRLGVEAQQQALMENIMKSLLGMSQTPGNFQSALGNIGSVLGLGGQAAGLFTGLGGLFGGGGAGLSGLPGGTRGYF